VRNLTKTIAAVSLLMPASAYSLGIGDIKLHSALNQKLDAEIALLVSAGENISDIKVRLASPDKFDEAGVPWSYFLSKIKFKAVTQADGSTLVKLSSNEALREPFLDFLLEVTWASGNLYREFTVLVDPPVSYKKATIPVIQKPQQAVAPIYAEQPVKIINRDVEGVSRTSVGQYGPTTKRDSLWKIAEKTNVYDDVSIEQMMMSIYEANPRAFYKKNVNALMAGQTLKIPEKEVILKLSKKQALAAFKQQDDVWSGRVAKKESQSNIDDSQLASQLELEAPVLDEIGDIANVVTDNKTTAKQIVDSEIDDSKVASSDEGLALQARMDKLEQQLVMMQKILILKDEKIATLQNKKQIESGDKTVQATEVAEPVVTPETVEPGKVKIKTLADIQAEKEATKIASIEAAKKPVEVAKVLPEKTAAKVEPVKKPKLKPKTKLKLKPAPVVEEETDYLTLAIGGGSALILGILGVLWWRRRTVEEEDDHESMFATASEISLPDSPDSPESPDEELSIPVADDSSLYNVGTVGESSFLSEFTPSDFDAFDTDQSEVDPVSEADVYLAYGRYQQAEDLMLQAIKDFPARDECKLKLLEIYFTNENKSSFESYAKELIAEGKPGDGAFWDKVVEMGREIDPDSALYTDKASFESVDLEKEQKPESEQVALDEVKGETSNIEASEADSDFDLSVFEDADIADEATDSSIVNAIEVQDASTALNEEVAVADENVLDFDLSVFDLDGTDEEKPEISATEAESVESIEFDLSSDSAVTSEPEEIKIEEPSEAADAESFDFDFDSGTETEETSVEPEVIDLASETDIDIDLESFDFSSDNKQEDNTALNIDDEIEVVDNSGVDDFEFDFDTPEIAPAPAADPVVSLDESVSDLTDMDELETKLDLAKAYIDMGDADAAVDIAKEILKKGSAEQKQAAQEIIDQLK